MGLIATSNNHIILIYNSQNSTGNQAKAYVTTSEKSIYTIDTAKDTLTATQWVEVAEGLHTAISQLINTKHPNFIQLYGDDVNMEDSEWLKVLEKNPQLVSEPILIVESNYYKIANPSSITTYLNTKNSEKDN